MTKKPESAQRAPGRPRSEAARQAILDATNALLETTTVRDLTIEAIAKKAGVGKATIYRWWSSKVALVIDAFASIVPRTRDPQAESVSEALREQVGLLIEHYSGTYGRIVAEVVGEGQAEPDVLADFRERFLLRRRALARDLIERGKATGEFAPDLDTDVACDLLYGPVYYRLMVGHLPLDRAFAEALPKQALSAFQSVATLERR